MLNKSADRERRHNAAEKVVHAVPVFVLSLLIASLVDPQGNIPGDPWRLTAEGIQTSAPGEATYDAHPLETFGAYTVTANGRNIGDTADEFRYVFMEKFGDFSVSACILAGFLGGDDDWAKACVMVRQNLSPGSPEIHQVATRNHGCVFQWRHSQDAPTEGMGFDRIHRRG